MNRTQCRGAAQFITRRGNYSLARGAPVYGAA